MPDNHGANPYRDRVATISFKRPAFRTSCGKLEISKSSATFAVWWEIVVNGIHPVTREVPRGETTSFCDEGMPIATDRQ